MGLSELEAYATDSPVPLPPVANAGPDSCGQDRRDRAADRQSPQPPRSGRQLSYAWTQTSGTSVILSDSTAVAPTFTAPTHAGDTRLQPDCLRRHQRLDRRPAGMAFDSSGNVYVVDCGNDRVQKFTAMARYLTQWGASGSGDGQFDVPWGIAADAAGNVYVADEHNHRIQKFTSTGAYLTQWGYVLARGDGQFNAPWEVAVDPAGNVYVADSCNNRIQKFTSTGAYLTQWGSYGTGDGQFGGYDIGGIASDLSGNVYVPTRSTDRIQKFTPPTPSASPAGDAAVHPHLAAWEHLRRRWQHRTYTSTPEPATSLATLAVDCSRALNDLRLADFLNQPSPPASRSTPTP